MKFLLDTHAGVWSVLQRSKLSTSAREAIESEENAVYVSVASAWEIAIKVGQGKWPEAAVLIGDFENWMDRAGFNLVTITIPHVRAAGAVKSTHRDPFDRLLAAQAQIEGLTIVSADPKVQALGGPWLW